MARFKGVLEGMARYSKDEAKGRPNLSGDAVWKDGAATLIDYGAPEEDAPVVLAIPSLINRSYILDLPNRSLMQYLKKSGLHAYLFDWGEPSGEPSPLSLEGYVLKRLEPALDLLYIKHRRPIKLVGYCMGGVLGLSLAARQPHKVDQLALLATPWDFTAAGYAATAPSRQSLEKIFASDDEVSAEAVHTWFYLQRPWVVHEKFAKFNAYENGSIKHREFLAIEQWLQDGVALSAPAAREGFIHWAHDNLPMLGRWNVGGKPVRLNEINVSTFVAVAERDSIVPPPASLPLVSGLPGAVHHSIPAGHISMVAGSKAANLLWKPLANWLLTEN